MSSFQSIFGSNPNNSTVENTVNDNDFDAFFNKIKANSVELKKLTEEKRAQAEEIFLLENKLKELKEICKNSDEKYQNKCEEIEKLAKEKKENFQKFQKIFANKQNKNKELINQNLVLKNLNEKLKEELNVEKEKSRESANAQTIVDQLKRNNECLMEEMNKIDIELNNEKKKNSEMNREIQQYKSSNLKMKTELSSLRKSKIYYEKCYKESVSINI
jgi:chromosome segregation ATPase